MKTQIIVSKSFFRKVIFNNYEIKNDFRKFLQKLRNHSIMTDLGSASELKRVLLDDNNNLWEALIENRPQIQYNISIPDTLEDSAFYRKSPIRKLFLVDLDSDTITSLRNRFGFEFISPLNINERWNIYKRYRDDELITTGMLDPNFLNSWEYFKNYQHPTNTLIIFDKYLFSEFGEVKKRRILLNSIEDNLYQFFSVMLPTRELKIEYQILIITSAANIKMKTYKLSVHYDDRFEELGNKIKEHLEVNYPRLNITFSLVNYFPAKFFTNYRHRQRVQSEHSRSIFTNYFQFSFDRGVNIVPISKSIDGKVETDIGYRFYFRPPFYDPVRRHLYRLSDYLRRLEEEENTRGLLFNYSKCQHLNVEM